MITINDRYEYNIIRPHRIGMHSKSLDLSIYFEYLLNKHVTNVHTNHELKALQWHSNCTKGKINTTDI